MAAAKQLQAENMLVRVVSMPSVDVFLQQPSSYQQEVLPESVQVRIAIEAASSLYWYRFVGKHGHIFGVDQFGASAPAKDVFTDCGLTCERIVAVAKEAVAVNAKSLHQCAS